MQTIICMKAILYLIFFFHFNFLSSQNFCDFESWQLEYFAFSKLKESSEFLKSNGWNSEYDRNNNQQKEYLKLTKRFNYDKGNVYYFKSDEIKLILMKLPAECWRSLKSGFKTSNSENIFFGDFTKTVKVKNPDTQEQGYIEFYTSNNNSTFNIIIYNQELKNIVLNLNNYKKAITSASNKMSTSNYTVEDYLNKEKNSLDLIHAKTEIIKSSGFLSQLKGYQSLNSLQNSQIVSEFFSTNHSFMLPKLKLSGDLSKSKYYVSSLERNNKKILLKLDNYTKFKESSDEYRNYSFQKFLDFTKEKDIKLIQTQIKSLIDFNTPTLWTLTKSPDVYNECFSNKLCYPYVEIDFNREINPLEVVDRNLSLRFQGYSMHEGKLVMTFYSTEDNRATIVTNIVEAVYNNSIEYSVVD